MTATLGHTSILLALLFAVWGIMSPILGARINRQRYTDFTNWAILAQFALVTLAATCLIYALVTTDFSLRYVAFNTTRATPIYYRITGLWGALEGSLLLWEWILIIFSGLVAWIYRDRQRETMPWVLMVFSIVSAFFLGVIAFVSNPFETISPVPLDGRGLNPLLEDANMMTHPPLLYTGFVGLTVPYAFAMAALIRGKVDEAWIVTTRRWTIIAWFFLTAGNLVGAWWSYHVLGWGGYWAWDPVENAAFMPWLPATAFLHSVQVQERRRMLKAWNLSLIIIAFSLTIFGTFLTRSGILSSIHAFSSGPVGSVFLVFLSFVLLSSFGLLAFRADLLKGQPELDSMVSRESAFLLNNIVLVSALFTIFLGTIFPLLSEAIAGTQVSVGAPYFNSVTVPLFLLLVFLMGVGPMHDVPIPFEQVRDPFEKNVPGLGLGRDPERTPMQWSGEEYAGFTKGISWLPLANDYPRVNVSLAQRQPNSFLTLYRRLIELRRAEPALSVGDFGPLPGDDDLMAYIRKTDERRLLVVLNLSPKTKSFSISNLQCRGFLLLSTYLDRGREGLQDEIALRADEGAIIELL